MAALLPRRCLSVLCVLALPAMAQDASFGIGEQTTRTDQTTHSSSTEIQNSGSMTTQTTTSGSSQSESRSESKGIDVGFGVHDNNDDWRDDRDVRDSDLVGSWTLGQGGRHLHHRAEEHRVVRRLQCLCACRLSDGFFSANRWVLSGNQLQLTDTSNTVFGRFRASGGGRWTGYRESDGARLYLNPKGR